MLNLVLKFAASARAAGMRIATSEVLDCLEQVKLIDVLDEPQFAAVLRANFAKSLREQQRFDHLYRLYFHELREDEDMAFADSIAEHTPALFQALQDTPNIGEDLPALLDFIAGDPLAYLDLLRNIQSEGESQQHGMGANLGSMVRRMPIMLAIERSRKAIDMFLLDHRDDIPWESRRDLKKHFNQRLDIARRLLTAAQLPEDSGPNKIKSYEKRLSRLGEQSFNSLTPKEVEEMRAVIQQLVRRLKDALGRRYAVRSRGILDIKKTLRHASRYQGIPLQLVFRKRPPSKGRIVVLCDVSGSVWSSARFMLNMLYSLQECFTRVRSFVFIAGIDDVTHFFDSFDVNQAIDKVLREADLAYGASTDYGMTFREFKKQYMDALNKKTTLIIIGDGRTNYANPEVGILEEMREQSRRLIWLNPETEYFWYSGDSEMRTYAPCCHEVRPCRNLNQLTTFIHDLVL